MGDLQLGIDKPLSTDNRNDQRKLMRLNELLKFCVWALTIVMDNAGPHCSTTFILITSSIRDGDRKWSEDDRERMPKTSSLRSRKVSRSGGSFEVEKLCWRKNKRY
ncbi:hypothetical protein Tco_1201183 [Tanacetum coccineum]